MRLRSLLIPLLLTACTVEQPPPPVPPPPPPPPPPASYASAEPEEPPLPPPSPKPSFENPGGMWMPQQLTEHGEKLKKLGLEIDPVQLADPTSKVLGAIVSLGGCSASFVSPDGLIVTNHHCVQRALQYNSTPEKNLIRDGFLAANRGEEAWNGPTARVYVTRSFQEVTREMLDGLEKQKNDRARYDELEARSKRLVAECEKGKTGVRCSVARFFDGAQYFRVEQLELRDVRLVYAPPESIGNYGGEIDNWRWPRHTGDFSFYRAYVGKDGSPADHGPENVPYKPPTHLKLASKPLEEGDLVFVAGYPGRTSIYKTAGEVKEAVSWSYPRRLKLCEDYIGALEEAARSDKEAAIRGAPLLRGLNNTLTNTKGQIDGLVKGGLAAEKERLEGALKTWVEGDPERKKLYGDVLGRMAQLHGKQEKTRDLDASVDELTRYPQLLGAALSVVRMAEERPKKDEQRKPDYQERNWKRLEQSLEALDKNYNRAVDQALIRKGLQRAKALPGGAGGDLLAVFTGKSKPSDEEIDKGVARLFERTRMEDGKERLRLLKEGKLADLRKPGDALMEAAVKLRGLQKAQQDREEAYAGAMTQLRPRYIAALRAMASGPLAPDANSTLRLTYGTVRGYSPAPGAPVHKAFTLLPEVVAKHTGSEPFNAPAALLEAAKAKKIPYADRRLGALPVNFLADLHITGGNSGSATLNARGELVGLAFDGNYESMASDWVFIPSITRSIHVDLRYMLWVMDSVSQADHLLREMGVEPKIP